MKTVFYADFEYFPEKKTIFQTNSLKLLKDFVDRKFGKDSPDQNIPIPNFDSSWKGYLERYFHNEQGN